MASKYDVNTLMDHYPFSKFFNHIKSQQDLNNDSHLQGLPTYDVYGLTKKDVIDYLSKKTEILLDAKDLYASKGEHISSRTALLFGICYVLAFICGAIYQPNGGENANGVFALLTLILLVLPFGIKALHKKCFIKKHNKNIYNAEIETYLDALSSYIDYLTQKIHHNWDKYIKQETRYYLQLKESENESLWHVKETRKFTPSEIECVIESGFSTNRGRRVIVKLINGETCFFRCHGDFNLTNGEEVDLANTEVVVLSNKTGDKIFKIMKSI